MSPLKITHLIIRGSAYDSLVQYYRKEYGHKLSRFHPSLRRSIRIIKF